MTKVKVPLGLFMLLLMCASCSSVSSIRKARDSFLHVVHKHTIQVCENNMCEARYVYSLGSGFVIGHLGEKTLGLTAGHVCTAKSESDGQVSVTTLKGAAVISEEVLVYPSVDVCILTLPLQDIPARPIARRAPRIGDKAFSISAPLGTFAPGMVPIFEGRYLGKVNSPLGMKLDAYSIPGTSGSSGGMIINEKGEVIGMTIMARVGFETFTLAVPYELLKTLLTKMP